MSIYIYIYIYREYVCNVCTYVRTVIHHESARESSGLYKKLQLKYKKY